MSETFTPANLIAGDFPIVSESVTLLSGTSYERGTVLGKITASGKLTTVNSAGTDDGRRTAYAVLPEAVDATSEDKTATVYLSGEFNQSALVFGGTDTYSTHKATLRSLGIFVKSSMTTAGVG